MNYSNTTSSSYHIKTESTQIYFILFWDRYRKDKRKVWEIASLVRHGNDSSSSHLYGTFWVSLSSRLKQLHRSVALYNVKLLFYRNFAFQFTLCRGNKVYPRKVGWLGWRVLAVIGKLATNLLLSPTPFRNHADCIVQLYTEHSATFLPRIEKGRVEYRWNVQRKYIRFSLSSKPESSLDKYIVLRLGFAFYFLSSISYS